MPKIKLLGDPHLGRQFVHGVPLQKRGTRENMVWRQFTEHVATSKLHDYHICMGDLFDKAVVPYNVIRRAAEVYINAATYCEDTTFVILKGNHDWMRDLTLPSAFDIFAKIVEPYPNIICVDKPVSVDGMGFVPWDPVNEVSAQVRKLKDVDSVYLHCDVTDYGGATLNLIPTAELKELGIKEAFNGHVHKPTEFERDGVKVHVVGSMQPYAHGEEVNEDLYLTRRFSSLGNLDQYTNRCLRVILGPDDVMADIPDCLQLTLYRESKDKEESPTVAMGDFDVEQMFLKALADGNVSKETTEKLHAIFQSKRLTN